MKLKLIQPLKNEKGVLTVDFIFGLLVILTIGAVFFALSFTLSMAEVAQYVVFSSSRAYFAADLRESDQQAAMAKKFSDLLSARYISILFGPQKFFSLTSPQVLNLQDQNTDPNGRDILVGVGAQFSSNILNIRSPVLGETGDQFNAQIKSFVGREPSFEECQQFEANRYQAILNLDSKYSSNPVGGGGGSSPYFVMMDNGC